tara:strand:+ start:59 stop:721 length:663 start_codon:yes stop_codon:yes gene_type:complete
MKLNILIIFLITYSFEIFSQTEKKTILFDGGIGTDFTIAGLSSVGNSEINTDVYMNTKSKISSSFMAGYFLNSTICLASGGAYEFSENSIEFYNLKQTSSSEMYMIYPLIVRAYFGDNFWSQIKYGIGSSNTLQTSNDLINFTSSEIKSPLTDLSLTFGYALYLNSALSFNPNLSYEIKTKENSMIDGFGNIFDIQETWGGLAFNFNLAFHLDRLYHHYY